MSIQLRSGAILAVGVVVGFSLAFGHRYGRALHAESDQTASLAPAGPAEVLADVIERVRREYVDRIDDQRLVEGAIRGILEELDQHSSFLDKDQYQEIRISTSGNYTGVGLDVNLDGGKVTVVAPLEGAPAARAGILPGDVVVSVDDVPVHGEDVAEAVSRMRGEAGTQVTLGVMRAGSDEPLRFALTRAPVQVSTVRSEYLGTGVGYVRLSQFSEDTARDLDNAARALRAASGG